MFNQAQDMPSSTVINRVLCLGNYHKYSSNETFSVELKGSYFYMIRIYSQIYIKIYQISIPFMI